MAQINPLTRELLIKLVYYGPGLGGKTTSLKRIHEASPVETRGQIVSLATPVDRTLYFDFLPLRADSIRGHHVRLQLFTVPGQVYFNATRKLVLTGADGVVFVADSQRARMDANLESFENLAENLEAQGRSLSEMPLILQYNKRDLPGVMSIEEMDAELNALGAPVFPSSAATGEGVLEALDALVQAVIEEFERKNRLELGGGSGERATPRFERANDGITEQLGRVSREFELEGSELREIAEPIPTHEAEERISSILPTVPPPPGLSFLPLLRGLSDLGDFERIGRGIEASLSEGDHGEAIAQSLHGVLSLLELAAQRMGLPSEERAPSIAAIALGFNSRSLLRLRTLALEPSPDCNAALEAYALFIEFSRGALELGRVAR